MVSIWMSRAITHKNCYVLQTSWYKVLNCDHDDQALARWATWIVWTECCSNAHYYVITSTANCGPSSHSLWGQLQYHSGIWFTLQSALHFWVGMCQTSSYWFPCSGWLWLQLCNLLERQDHTCQYSIIFYWLGKDTKTACPTRRLTWLWRTHHSWKGNCRWQP